ncbi:MAG: hypothetical protein HOV80_13480 [Polyangiaceae bacterium]|nr:hypothetical protein [Polyangiaceae bacterium]
MSGRVATVIGAVLLCAVGFAAGAAGSAWQTREQRTQPWRKIKVEHEGQDGSPTRTRLIFENPKLAVQAVEIQRDSEGLPTIARVALKDGDELTLRYSGEKRPSSIEASDGSRALFEYTKSKVHVSFVAGDGTQTAESVSVPNELRSALKLAEAEPTSTTAPTGAVGGVLDRVLEEAVGTAFAQDKKQDEDPTITARREVEINLDVKLPGGDPPGRADVETSCPPLSCTPVASEIDVPGQKAIRINVSGSLPRSQLHAPKGASDIDPYRDFARAERKTAKYVLPDAAAAVAAVGVTALACKAQKLALGVCVPAMTKAGASGGAAHAILEYQVPTEGQVVTDRAETVWYEEEAREHLDRETKIELCLGREGFARVCTDVMGRPFGSDPMAPVARAVDLRKGIGGTLVGSYFLIQSDGADCKFSPSPKTSGTLRLTFDNEKNTATASLKTSERGTRPNMSCSLGVANMSWSQTYSITATQTFTKEALSSGGKLPLSLSGTMSGNGSYSFSNCRTGSGGSVNCPAGKSDSYAYPVEITGELDLTTQVGSGSIIVKNAPLTTSGSWRIPEEKK